MFRVKQLKNSNLLGLSDVEDESAKFLRSVDYCSPVNPPSHRGTRAHSTTLLGGHTISHGSVFIRKTISKPLLQHKGLSAPSGRPPPRSPHHTPHKPNIPLYFSNSPKHFIAVALHISGQYCLGNLMSVFVCVH